MSHVKLSPMKKRPLAPEIAALHLIITVSVHVSDFGTKTGNHSVLNYF